MYTSLYITSLCARKYGKFFCWWCSVVNIAANCQGRYAPPNGGFTTFNPWHRVLLTDELATTKKTNKIQTPKIWLFLPFSGLFCFLGSFTLEEEFWARKGQNTSLTGNVSAAEAGSLFCLFLLLCFAMSASHAVKIRRSRPRIARLDLDSISGAGDYTCNTTETAANIFTTATFLHTCRRQVYRDIPVFCCIGLYW